MEHGPEVVAEPPLVVVGPGQFVGEELGPELLKDLVSEVLIAELEPQVALNSVMVPADQLAHGELANRPRRVRVAHGGPAGFQVGQVDILAGCPRGFGGFHGVVARARGARGLESGADVSPSFHVERMPVAGDSRRLCPDRHPTARRQGAPSTGGPVPSALRRGVRPAGSEPCDRRFRKPLLYPLELRAHRCQGVRARGGSALRQDLETCDQRFRKPPLYPPELRERPTGDTGLLDSRP